MAPRAVNAGAVAQEVLAPMQPESSDDGPLVYLIQSVNGGPVKIGYVKRASSLPARLADLQTGSAYKLQVVKTVPGGPNIETEIHQRFAHWRLSGEWFLPAKEIEKFCGRGLGRRGEAKALENRVELAYRNGYERGFNEGDWHGRKALAKQVYATIGTPEEWDEIQTVGPHLDRIPLEAAS